MSHRLEFFELQAFFAGRVAEVAKIPIETALLKYTMYYKRIGAEDCECQKNHPRWKEFIERIRSGKQPAAAAYDMYRKAPSRRSGPAKEFGCVCYTCKGEVVNPHFSNNTSSHQSPLADHLVQDRIAELTALFAHIARHHPEIRIVEGNSWLYGRERYRRLFPPEYIANMQLVPLSARRTSAWGQFISGMGGLNPKTTDPFREKVGTATSLQELLDSFPYGIYKPSAPIECFYRFYGITTL